MRACAHARARVPCCPQGLPRALLFCLSLCRVLSLSPPLSRCLFLCVSLAVARALILSRPLSRRLAVSPFPFTCLSTHTSRCHRLSLLLYLSHALFILPLSLSFSPSFALSLAQFLCLTCTFVLSLSLSLSLFPSLSLSLSLPSPSLKFQSLSFCTVSSLCLFHCLSFSLTHSYTHSLCLSLLFSPLPLLSLSRSLLCARALSLSVRCTLVRAHACDTVPAASEG